MEFLRTANAGGLLKMDGISVLLDGVCERVEPYEGTPEKMLDQLSNNYPDAVGFTHRHPDHFLESFACQYENTTGRKTLITGDTEVSVGNVRISCFPTRHLGRVEEGLVHSSFLLKGSKTVLFSGDAAPLSLKNIQADVLIAPFAYANSAGGIKAVLTMGVRDLILVHMPSIDPDQYGIWDSVRNNLPMLAGINVHIPAIGEKTIID